MGIQKGFPVMRKILQPDERNPKIVPLVTPQEQAEVEALSRYWDARLQGRVADPAQLGPEVRDMVQLLEHYREVADPLPMPAPVADSPPLWLRPAQVAAVALAMVALLLFASNTLLSPRSWLFSSAPDPDWIPWVSDDWLSAHALTSEIVIPRDIMKEISGDA